jgi:hypothetical protein
VMPSAIIASGRNGSPKPNLTLPTAQTPTAAKNLKPPLRALASTFRIPEERRHEERYLLLENILTELRPSPL